jgi:hypothetical protein
MKNWIARLANHPHWKAIALAFLVFLSLQVPFSLHIVSELKDRTGGFGAPDIAFFQGSVYVEQFLTQSKQEGLDYYLSHFLVMDIVFPLSVALFMCLLLSGILKRLFSAESKAQYLVLFPLIGASFDYIENASIAFAIHNLPDISQSLLIIIPVFTLLKLIFVLASWVLLLAFAFGLLIKKLR